MNIEDLDIKIHYRSTKPIKITSLLTANNNVLVENSFISQSTGYIPLGCNIPVKIPIFIIISTDDSAIYENPLYVTSFELDHFYDLKTYAFKGTNQYDQKFLEFVKLNNLFVTEQTNNNCLFFTGKLIYTITSPISEMLFKKNK